MRLWSIFFSFLLLLGCEGKNEEIKHKKYYGWLGNCTDSAYEFNFNENYIVLYNKLRYTLSGKDYEKYSITKGVIKKMENQTYFVVFENNEPLELKYDFENDRIWANSEEFQSVYFNLCGEEAFQLVESAIENQRQL